MQKVASHSATKYDTHVQKHKIDVAWHKSVYFSILQIVRLRVTEYEGV
jgi:hypothetical protein